MSDWQPPVKDDTWASQFVCRCHGRCTEQMVMTTKCCLTCASQGHTEGLIRDAPTEIPLRSRLVECRNCDFMWEARTANGPKRWRLYCPKCNWQTRWMVA